VLLLASLAARAQVNTADLSGQILDLQGLLGSPGVTSPFVPGVSFTLPTVCDAAGQLPPVPVPIPPAMSISPPVGCTGNLGRNTFVRPSFRQFDLRPSRKFYFTEKVNLEVIADMFNLLNPNNKADVNPLCDLSSPTGTCTAGQPTASLDPRQFQFALKISCGRARRGISKGAIVRRR
jgi:hypothetical protein